MTRLSAEARRRLETLPDYLREEARQIMPELVPVMEMMAADFDSAMRHITALESDLAAARAERQAADALAEAFKRLWDAEATAEESERPRNTAAEWSDAIGAYETYRAARASERENEE